MSSKKELNTEGKDKVSHKQKWKKNLQNSKLRSLNVPHLEYQIDKRHFP